MNLSFRVTIEYVGDSHLTYIDCDTVTAKDDAVLSAKNDPKAWHIFVAKYETPTMSPTIVSSYYRAPYTREWVSDLF